MSANIMWRPTAGSKSLSVTAPSTFLDSMERVFGSRPFRLGQDAVPQLTAMAAVFADKENNPFQAVLDILERHDEIEVWAEY